LGGASRDLRRFAWTRTSVPARVGIMEDRVEAYEFIELFVNYFVLKRCITLCTG
jgi:hypothetical protein